MTFMLPVLILMWFFREIRLQTVYCFVDVNQPLDVHCSQVGRVNYAQWLPVNVDNTETFCSPPASGHGSNKLSPYLREEVVKRIMVHVADAVEKGLTSVMFTTVLTV